MADEEEVEGGPAAEPVPEGPFASPELLEACMLGKLGRLKAFLDKNPDDLKLVSEKRGWSPLQVAVGFSKMEIVQELIERKADIVTPDKMGMTVLHTAADCDTADIVQVILDTEEGKGLIDAVDADGCTPLHYAAYSGRLANCTTLLKAGANTEIADASGKTAKQVAQEMKENKVVDLITNGPPTEEAA